MTFVPTVTRSHKNSVRCATEDNLTLSGIQTIDSVVTVEGDRVLLAGQSSSSQNGIWIIGSSVWARSPDLDTTEDLKPALQVTVSEGVFYGGKTFQLITAAPYILDVTGLDFSVVLEAGVGVSSVNGETGVVMLSAEDVGADPEGTATDAISDHIAELDPHTGYVLESALPTEINNAITDHVNEVDPHTQYTTVSEATSISDVQASGVIAIHNASLDPHSQYTTVTEVTTISDSSMSVHLAELDPHTQYMTSAETSIVASGIIEVHNLSGDPHSQYAFDTDIEEIRSAPILTYSGSASLSSDRVLTAGDNISIVVQSGLATISNVNSYFIVGNTVSGIFNSDTHNYSGTGWNDSGNSKAAVIIANVEIPCKLTGVTGGTPGRELIIHNAGTSLLLIENESSESTSGNRFSGLFPSFLMPGDTLRFVYISNGWKRIGEKVMSIDFDSWDDFEATTSILTSVITSGGTFTQSNVTVGDPVQKPIGVATLGVTSTSDRSSFRAGAGQPFFTGAGTGSVLTLSRVNITTLNDGVNNISFRTGVGDSEGIATPTDGAYWEYTSTSNFWQIVTAASGVISATPTTLSVSAGDYIWLGVVMNTDWSRADFFAKTLGTQWQFVGSKTSGLPSGSSLATYSTVLAKILGSTLRNTRIDVLAYRFMSLINR